MKTKEIDGYVCKYALDSFEAYKDGYTLMVSKVQHDKDIKIKLIIEIPEKKVTISESEFEEAWLKAVGTTWDKDKTDLMKELFS